MLDPYRMLMAKMEEAKKSKKSKKEIRKELHDAINSKMPGPYEMAGEYSFEPPFKGKFTPSSALMGPAVPSTLRGTETPNPQIRLQDEIMPMAVPSHLTEVIGTDSKAAGQKSTPTKQGVDEAVRQAVGTGSSAAAQGVDAAVARAAGVEEARSRRSVPDGGLGSMGGPMEDVDYKPTGPSSVWGFQTSKNPSALFTPEKWARGGVADPYPGYDPRDHLSEGAAVARSRRNRQQPIARTTPPPQRQQKGGLRGFLQKAKNWEKSNRQQINDTLGALAQFGNDGTPVQTTLYAYDKERTNKKAALMQANAQLAAAQQKHQTEMAKMHAQQAGLNYRQKQQHKFQGTQWDKANPMYGFLEAIKQGKLKGMPPEDIQKIIRLMTEEESLLKKLPYSVEMQQGLGTNPQVDQIQRMIDGLSQQQ